MSSTSSAEEIEQDEKSMRRPLLSEIPTLSGTSSIEEDKERNDEAQLVLMAEHDREYKKKPIHKRVLEELRLLLAFATAFILHSAPPERCFISRACFACLCLFVGGTVWRCRSA